MNRFLQATLITLSLFFFLPKESCASELKLSSLDFVQKWIEQETRIQEIFPIPQELRRSVDFWTKIYSEYGSNDLVVHDSNYPNIIYAVIESDNEEANKNPHLNRKERVLVEKATDEIIRNLKTLDRLGQDSYLNFSTMTPDQQHISSQFSSIDDPEKFKKAASRNRIATIRGVRDRFEEALYRSGYYLDAMIDVLEPSGVPLEFIALVFPESMFLTSARSTAKAVGLWQFIPAAAREDSLKINDVVDERKDPLLATRAAARKLKREYDEYCAEISDPRSKIQDDGESKWPHAALGYIWGKGAVQKAMERLKSSELCDIIFKHKSASKGFYVRNYYPQFLAASYVYRYWQHFFPDLEIAPSWEETTTEMVLERKASFPKIAATLGIEEDSLSFLNPKYTKQVVNGAFPVPPGSAVRIPKGSETLFAEVNKEPKKRPSSLATDWTGKVIEYIVQKGDTLWDIAQRVGVPVDTLLKINRLPTASLAIDQRILIPAVKN